VEVAGLLRTGGASRRMSPGEVPLALGGERLADRGARLLSVVGSRVLEVGPGHTPLPAVREDPPGQGRHAGVAAGALALRARVDLEGLARDAGGPR
jgi:molybdopterin-guanine dinucleotide biosynthesis protein A